MKNHKNIFSFFFFFLHTIYLGKKWHDMLAAKLAPIYLIDTSAYLQRTTLPPLLCASLVSTHMDMTSGKFDFLFMKRISGENSWTFYVSDTNRNGCKNIRE